MATTETLNFSTANGDTTAFVAKPEGDASKAVILIQEWWGVNDHIKDIARRYADEGFLAITPDLYRGKLATNPTEAGEMMNALAVDDGLDIIANTVGAASEKFGNSHFGITGYCMGGTFALRSACLLEGFAAAVPFYGDIPDEETFSKLRTPTIFISGTKDGWINTEKVATLEDITARYELPLQSVKYEADHAFFNDTRPEVYDATAAADSWAMAVAFFKEKL